MADEFAKKYTFMIDVAIAMENKIKESYADLTILERRIVLNNAFMRRSVCKAYPVFSNHALNMKLMDRSQRNSRIIWKIQRISVEIGFCFFSSREVKHNQND